jgi:hypothetical protein
MGNIWPPGDTNQRELPWSEGEGGVSLQREVERLEKGDAKEIVNTILSTSVP